MTAISLTMMAIAGDRFFAIVYPLKAKVTKRKVKLVVLFVWVCSLAIAVPPLIAYTYYERRWSNYLETFCHDIWPARELSDGSCDQGVIAERVYWAVVISVLFWIPMVMMTINYTVIIHRLHSSRVVSSNSGGPGMSVVQRRSSKKVVKMLFTLLITFMVCAIPFQVVTLYENYKDRRAKLPSWFQPVYFTAVNLMYAHSGINPIMYGAMNQTFQAGFKQLVVRVRRQKFKSSPAVSKCSDVKKKPPIHVHKPDVRRNYSDKFAHQLVNAARRLKFRRRRLPSDVPLKRKLPSNDAAAPTQRTVNSVPLAAADIPSSSASVAHPFKSFCPTSRTGKIQDKATFTRANDGGVGLNETMLRGRSPSVSPVVTPCFATNSLPSPVSHHPSPAWQQSFSINAILGRASSTPKKIDSSLQSSYCSSHVTSPESGSSNIIAGSPDSTEPNKENQTRCVNSVRGTCTDIMDCRTSSDTHCCHNCQHSQENRRKMERTKFSKEDIEVLTGFFLKDRYPSSMEIEQLANKLGYRVVQIKTWFQNKRASVSGTRRPKTQSPAPVINYPSTPLGGHHTMLLPVPNSIMENFSYHQSLLNRQSTVPAVNIMTPYPTFSPAVDNNFTTSTGHYLPTSHTSRVLPSPVIGPFPPLSSFHYLGQRFL
ncbi:hypothetical protein Btru_068960 [Bulinus truncatus]|nr:hypothetical protein Btru_068960 [Bulinus truncatus]